MDLELIKSKIRAYCARSERCRYDVLRKLASWNVDSVHNDEIISMLESSGFLDEERYVQAFVHDKSSLSGWGELKIKSALKAKGISSKLIEIAIGRIDNEKTAAYINHLINENSALLNDQKGREKLIRRLLSKGFPKDLVFRELNRFRCAGLNE